MEQKSVVVTQYYSTKQKEANENVNVSGQSFPSDDIFHLSVLEVIVIDEKTPRHTTQFLLPLFNPIEKILP